MPTKIPSSRYLIFWNTSISFVESFLSPFMSSFRYRALYRGIL